ncbi:Saccharopine dehydrogenase [Malassezia vespertilionis]|uniref:Saccharopine dehydrogenase n=1 Tax=Malassezia vespertilionis TaxID=2020962 RepID=UPI0024B19FA4|nr:Saccharopine dehydrogenase [Malassezia vespertilionis]WFD08448.1 Saccharopine dehydrogenase [Malassezia vespertilionis]
MASQPLWLRCETKPAEHRSALTPTTAKKLIENGFEITVERDPQRIFDDAEFEAVGCTMADYHSWPKAPKATPIIGLKELDTPGPDLENTHIQFAHCYKNQEGWVDVLGRFKRGGGKLYDLEFLEDAQGRRVAAFGWHAGFAGAALGLLGLAEQLNGGKLGAQTKFDNEDALLKETSKAVENIRKHRADGKATALVIGALGRCGRGAVSCFERSGMKPEEIVRWDLQETSAKSGPYQEILDVDIFVNCIYLRSKIPNFIDTAFINQAGANRRLGMVVDVSCDTTNPNNPLPVYSINTTFDKPTVDVELAKGVPKMEVISIDHLPTLLPREASEAFSDDLLPSLLQLPFVTGAAGEDALKHTHEEGKGAVWTRAEKLFRKHLADAVAHGA